MDEMRISVGECLDQLLNRECLFPFEILSSSKEIADHKFGGIVCPGEKEKLSGTGNIIIKGAAGTGKSTLALQIAVEAARRNRNVNTAYISLEESPDQIINKGEMFGWKPWLQPVDMYHNITASEVQTRNKYPDRLKEMLERPVTNQPECEKLKENKEGTDCSLNWKNKVLLPMLAPRAFEAKDDHEKRDSLFWLRMEQLEDLLYAAHELNKKSFTYGNVRDDPRLDIICVDSLNVLGQGHLTRDHLSALFDLFRRHNVIGVFIYEQIETIHPIGHFDSNLKDIEFLGDMIINLTGNDDNQEYWLRHFHITKSRYQHQVLGRQPFKIFEHKAKKDDSCSCSDVPGKLDDSEKYDCHDEKCKKECPYLITARNYTKNSKSQEKDNEIRHREVRESRAGIKIYPSLHTLIRSSDNSEKNNNNSVVSKDGNVCDTGNAAKNNVDSKKTNENKEKIFFQDKHLNQIGGESLRSNKPVVATIFGPDVSGKSIIAHNFLIQGLIQGKNGLMITLGENLQFGNKKGVLAKKVDSSNQGEDYDIENKLRIDTMFYDLMISNADKRPGEIYNVLNYFKEHHKLQVALWGNDKIKNYIVELALKPGALLPEELAYYIRQIYKSFSMQSDGDENKGNAKDNNMEYWPRRAVLHNASSIGYAYPFLRKPTTGPELFLPSLAHLFHCRGTDLLITAVSGGIPDSELIAKEAVALADSAIECSHQDVFGDRYVTITGPGMIEDDVHNVNTPEGVPGVLRQNDDSFEIDMAALDGLVGFASGDIRRPGVVLQLFEEGKLLRQYNHEIKRMVEFAMGCKDSEGQELYATDETVLVDVFNAAEAGSLHNSLRLLDNAPLSNTIIRTVDEFASEYTPKHSTDPASEEDELLTKIKHYNDLYYRNIFLLICDSETYKHMEEYKKDIWISRWKVQLLEVFKQIGDKNAICESFRENEDTIKALKKILVKARTDSAARPEFEKAKINKVIGLAESFKSGIGQKGFVSKLESSYTAKDIGALIKDINNKSIDEVLDSARSDYVESTLSFWQKFEALVTEKEQGNLTFLYDDFAHETFASLAMDGILSIGGLAQGKLNLEDRKVNNELCQRLKNKKTGGKDNLYRFVKCIGNILPEAKPIFGDSDQEGPSDFANEVFLDENKRFVALCWYTQFRDLINSLYDSFENNKRDLEQLIVTYLLNRGYDIDPDAILSSRSSEENDSLEEFLSKMKIKLKNIRVLSLPGGGFKGDWYLQVPSGSVSESLGDKICDCVLSPEEDYYRFRKGIGLPAWPRKDSKFPENDFKTEYAKKIAMAARVRFKKLQDFGRQEDCKILPAWRHGEVPLQVLFDIHRFAHRRSEIKGYKRIHNELYAIMEEIRVNGVDDNSRLYNAECYKLLILKAIQRLLNSSE